MRIDPNTFPIKISANRRYLMDQNDNPFLIQGDTAWSIITACTKDEAELYLRNRAAKGFNAIIINLIEHFFNGPLTRSGEHPFQDPGDLSTPNEVYFALADWVLRRAEEYGILVFLAPLYLGYDSPRNNEGWFNEARRSGSGKCFQYGQYLGKRYKEYKNILWMIGGDRNPGGVIEEIKSLVQGTRHGSPDVGCWTG